MSLEIPKGPFEAYLFDCDGTLADTMPLHFIAWQRALAPHSCDFPESLFYEWGGKPTRRIVADLNELQDLKMDAESIEEEREGFYLEQLHTVKPVVSVVEFLLGLPKETKKAVVSGGPTESVSKTLKLLELSKHFEHLICSEDYTHGKPHPDCYLEAAKRLEVNPERCLVFEDAATGVKAALAAGMQCVRVPNALGNKK